VSARAFNTEQAELLLDSYSLELGAMAAQLDLIDKEIDATESLLKFQLDTARNTLIKVPLTLKRSNPKPETLKFPT
jgi:hypothetical protein